MWHTSRSDVVSQRTSDTVPAHLVTVTLEEATPTDLLTQLQRTVRSLCSNFNGPTNQHVSRHSELSRNFVQLQSPLGQFTTHGPDPSTGLSSCCLAIDPRQWLLVFIAFIRHQNFASGSYQRFLKISTTSPLGTSSFSGLC